MWLVAIQPVEFFHIFEIWSIFSKIREFNTHERVVLEIESIEAALPKELRDLKDWDLGHSCGLIWRATELASILSNNLLLDMHEIFAELKHKFLDLGVLILEQFGDIL